MNSNQLLVEDHARGTILGNCVGDAIGLSTEFMTKSEAADCYTQFRGCLEYQHKVNDHHRRNWMQGDWTDDSDQMFLIMQSIVDCQGQVNEVDFAKKLQVWAKMGFKELGDTCGCGMGGTTQKVLKHESFLKDPYWASCWVWSNDFDKQSAPNGAIMRTSALGLYRHNDINSVIANTVAMCKVTHTDPRCQASCVAVTVAIAEMLKYFESNVTPLTDNNLKEILRLSVVSAAGALRQASADYDINEQVVEGHFDELLDAIYASDLEQLRLDDNDNIGYTFKALGAGFWALKQTSFRKAIEAVTMEGGDADTNCAVAGALLGCKLGVQGIPLSWQDGLAHRQWLEQNLKKFLDVAIPNSQQKRRQNVR